MKKKYLKEIKKNEIFKFSSEKIVININIKNFLYKQAKLNHNKKAMILIHQNPLKNKFHEMLICIIKGIPIAPHINSISDKSYHVIHGKIQVIFFNNNGKIKSKKILNGKSNFFIRFKKNTIHTIKIISKYCLFFERVLGPHKKTKYFYF